MYKVLIVDDEPFLREGLKRIIKWEEYDYEICGEAQNGRIALKMIEELKPELIVIDMKMPGMDGISVIEEVRKSNSKCKFIILTGYADFNYAVKAISNDVNAYLLKPISKDELIESIKKIHELIEKEVSGEDIEDKKDILIQNFIVRLMTEEILDKELEERKRVYGINLDWKRYEVILIDIPIDNNEYVTPNNSLLSQISDFIKEDSIGYSFITGNLFGILLCPLESEANISRINYLKENIDRLCKRKTCFTIGKIVSDFGALRQSYKKVFTLMFNKFLFIENEIIMEEAFSNICMEGKKENGELLQAYLEEIKEKLIVATDIGDEAVINTTLKLISDKFRENLNTEGVIKLTYINLYKDILQELYHMNGSSVEGLLENSEAVIKNITLINNLHELEAYIFKVMMAIASELYAKSADGKIKKLINYINNNYEKDIKLETLAEMFNYNSNYLGRQFKGYTGLQFNTYLNQLRVEKAKILLEEGLKVYEVARKVGYSDIDYFCANFKKYTGVSPSSFKK